MANNDSQQALSYQDDDAQTAATVPAITSVQIGKGFASESRPDLNPTFWGPKFISLGSRTSAETSPGF